MFQKTVESCSSQKMEGQSLANLNSVESRITHRAVHEHGSCSQDVSWEDQNTPAILSANGACNFHRTLDLGRLHGLMVQLHMKAHVPLHANANTIPLVANMKITRKQTTAIPL